MNGFGPNVLSVTKTLQHLVVCISWYCSAWALCLLPWKPRL